MRTEPAGLAQGHRRMNAEHPGLIARRADDATIVRPAAADDDRLAPQLRVIALLDRGEERVEIDVEDDPGPGRLLRMWLRWLRHRPIIALRVADLDRMFGLGGWTSGPPQRRSGAAAQRRSNCQMTIRRSLGGDRSPIRPSKGWKSATRS